MTRSPAAGRQQLAPYAIHDFNSYMGALYNVAIENLNPARPEDWTRTVSTIAFKPKTKRISDKQMQQLMDSGRAEVQAFFVR